MTEADKRIIALKRSIDELYDNQVRQRRMLSDLLYNLDEENMPAVKALIERYKAEDGEAIAALKVSANENYAAIEGVAAVQTEQGESIAALKSSAEENYAAIEGIAAVQTEQSETIASLSQQATELSAEVVIAVERSQSAENTASEVYDSVSNGAYIIARVNEDGSLVKIKADKLELTGYVTVAGLKTAGATEIDGANLKTGTVVADRIALNANGQIDFDNLGALCFLAPSGAGGEIRLNESELGGGEITVRADRSVNFEGGGASLSLSDGGSGYSEARMYAGALVMNGEHGLSGTYSFGDGSITVENGIIVAVNGEGGGGGDEPNELAAPTVHVDGEYYSFSIENPNGVGTICYYTYWYDDYGGSAESAVFRVGGSHKSGSFEDFPPGGGYVGIRAWIEYNGRTSGAVNEEFWYA
jgi:hypothetical protein